MTPPPCLLIDFDGVINNTHAMLAHYGKTAGRLLAEQFGGTSIQWQEAHQQVMRAMVTWSPEMFNSVGKDYNLFYREENRRWIAAMFRLLKRERPDELAAQQVADDLRYAIPNAIRTPLPGAINALNTLSNAGHTLILTSAGCHAHCLGALEALGVSHLFRRIYGVDLVNQFKDSPTFFDKVLDEEDLIPADCLAIDDRPNVLSWARRLGIRTAHIVPPGTEPDRAADFRAASLAELASVLAPAEPESLEPASNQPVP